MQANKATASPVFEQFATPLARALIRKLVGGINIKSVRFADEVDDDDQDGAQEAYDSFVSRFSSALKDLVRKLSALVPQLMLGLCGAEVGTTMSQMRSVEHASITSQQAKPFIALQGSVELLDAVVRNGVPETDVGRFTNEFQGLLRYFYEFETQNPLLLSLKIRSLRCFSCFYRIAPQILTSVLERLLQLVLFRLPSEASIEHANLSKLTMRVRMEACDSFQRLCVDMPDILVAQLGPLSTHVSEKLIKANRALSFFLVHFFFFFKRRKEGHKMESLC